MKYRLFLMATAAVLLPASAALAQTAPAPADKPAAEKPASGDKATTVQGVTVTGERDGYRSEIDRRSYSLAGDLQATTGSVADALRSVPSVQVDVNGNVSLRGDGNVTILVDGKPSALFNGESRGEALQSLSADQFERVEVMTNPSAAYSPEGTGGVINLISKKEKRANRYVTVRGNVGTGERYNGGINGVYSDGRLTLNGDLGYRRDGHAFDGIRERSRFDSVSGLFLDSRQEFESENRGEFVSLRGSADYDLTPKTRLSASVFMGKGSFNMESDESFEGEDALGAIVSAYDREVDAQFDRTFGSGTLRLRQEFAGNDHNFTGELSYDASVGERTLLAVTTYDVPVQGPLYEDIGGEFEQGRWRLKGDYNRPIGEDQRLKVGGEVEVQLNDFDNYGARGPAPGSLVLDPALTNRFKLEQRVEAIYATYERPFGDLTIQAGLRAEAVQIDINQVTSGIRAENDYTGLYPSLHLGYDLTDDMELKASYSRRIQRPSPQDLNPYVVYVDPLNLRSGNPDLEPQITDSFELSWQYRKGQTYYNVTGYYRQSRDGVTDVVLDLGNGVFLTTRENLAESRNGGFEFNLNGRFTPKITYNASVNAYWNEIEASGIAFGKDRSGWTVGGFASLNWQLTDKDFLQLNGFYMGQTLMPQGYREGTGTLNIGYRHKFNDDLSFVVTAQDILGTFEDRLVIDTPLLRERVDREFSNRTVFVGFRWTFGQGQRRPRDAGFDFDNNPGGGVPGG